MNNNTQLDMIGIADVFIGAYEHVVSNFTLDKQQLAKRFTAELVMQQIPYMMITPEGVANLQGLVFGHADNRDFIMTLTFVTFARLGCDEEFVHELAKILARGLTVPVYAKDSNMIPDEINSRLAKYDDVVGVLRSNLWIITILLMQLFISQAGGEEGKKS